MGRRSKRIERRSEIARAFARVLGSREGGGVTIAAVAAEAKIAPGLVHHHFDDKQDLFAALLDEMLVAHRLRADAEPGGDPVDRYVNATLGLGERSDVVAARAWVGIFAEALRDPALFAKVRRLLDSEVAHVERRAGGALTSEGASALVAFVVGALVFGSFAPRRAAGFAAPSARKLVAALRYGRR